ncbi:MAG: hypothetical protein Kow0080_01890 [Candidatus Promineifilaceae bacterium]
MAKKSIQTRKAAKNTQSSGTKMYWVIGGGILAAVAIIGLLYSSLREPAGIEGIQKFVSPARDHDNTLVYEGGDKPQPGGSHHDIWQNCGVYTSPINEANALHSLEHGAVWITYNDSLPQDEVQILEQLGRENSYVLVSPYPTQTSPVVLTAWATQLETDSAKDSRVAEFVDRYQQGIQTPERGATCSGGIGSPAN